MCNSFGNKIQTCIFNYDCTSPVNKSLQIHFSELINDCNRGIGKFNNNKCD